MDPIRINICLGHLGWNTGPKKERGAGVVWGCGGGVETPSFGAGARAHEPGPMCPYGPISKYAGLGAIWISPQTNQLKKY